MTVFGFPLLVLAACAVASALVLSLVLLAVLAILARREAALFRERRRCRQAEAELRVLWDRLAAAEDLAADLAADVAELIVEADRG